MNQAPYIQGRNVVLRKPEPRDKADRYVCGRTYEWVRMLGGDTRDLKPFTLEDAERWWTEIDAKPLEWAVEFEGKCIGQARLSVNEEDRRARYAVGLFDSRFTGRGLGTEVTRLVLHHAFNTLKLHRVDLKVLSYNARAIACYERCGFVKEGIEREGALIEGVWESDFIMSILEQEYQASL